LNLIWLGRLFEPPRRKLFRVAFLAATALTLVGFVVIRSVWRNTDATLHIPILYASSFWMIFQVVLLAAWPFSALLVWWRTRRENRAKEEKTATDGNTFPRRDFLRRAAFLPPALAMGVSATGFAEASNRMVCTYVDIIDNRWPSQLDGLKIAHLTDLHLGPFVSPDHLKKALSLLDDSKPDLLAITGDFCDNLALLETVAPMLRDFVAKLPLGAYFCMGNHEYFRGAHAFLNFMPSVGVQILINEKVTIRRGGASFSIAGADHPMALGSERDEQMARNIAKLTTPPSAAEYMVLLCHHPAYVEPAARQNIPLTLLGHTHGGQVGLFGKTLGEAFTPYSKGLYPKGKSKVYVSSGAGHWFPFRFNCPPEVSLLRMRS
jgi:predicted MPP superfamily phosphohydrolase